MAAAGEQLLAGRRIPVSAYRVQFGRSFTFREARSLVPYWERLGITDLYASPFLRARADGNNSYDICDLNLLDPTLGSREEFDALAAALRERGMGLLMDMVPNHMGISEPCNDWWMDVLENGPASTFASYFDIDWHPVKPEMQGKVLLPILEDQYGAVLEAGKLKLGHANGSFFIDYYQTRLPIAPPTYDRILSRQLDELAQALGPEDERVHEYQSIVTAAGHLPSGLALTEEQRAERNREKEVIKRRLAALAEASPAVGQAITAAVASLNGQPGEPRSFDALDELLQAQSYRLAFWRVAAEEINYRRFFDINGLAAVRVELPEVFQATHRLVLELLRQGQVTGLRIDHPDGLWDPRAYFRQLQEQYAREAMEARLAETAPGEDGSAAIEAWLAGRRGPRPAGESARPLYMVAEKILSGDEVLPADWDVDGTTGYDYLNYLNGLFVDSRRARAFDNTYAQFVGRRVAYSDIAYASRKLIMDVSLASEVTTLGHHMERIAETSRCFRDFTLNGLTSAIREVIACFPVYRTYIAPPANSISRQDRSYVEAAVAEARRRNPQSAGAVFDFLRDMLLLRNLDDFPEEHRREVMNFVMKFQQVTSPVMAKGLEDTAFYVYNRLNSLNEVGGGPDRFGVSVAAFHRQNEARWQRWPHSLLATSTHDTKRSEDVRARINVLSEMPEEWRAGLTRWGRLNAAHKTLVDGRPAPDANDEYMLYQAVVGAWPPGRMDRQGYADFRDRIAAYMLKATREAKVHTSWINPNERYDGAVRDFVLAVLPADAQSPFLADLEPLRQRVAFYGRLNSLSQVLLKLTSPGVPDIYQGNEVWDFSLVDPDNRRPVDYAPRQRTLAGLEKQVGAAGDDLLPLVQQLLSRPEDDRIKLYLTWRALSFRHSHAALFRQGSYLPLEASGERARHVCAFARVLGGQRAVVAVPRLALRLTGARLQLPLGQEAWRETWLALPRERTAAYRNVLTGEMVSAQRRAGSRGLPVAALFATFPVALLERIPQS